MKAVPSHGFAKVVTVGRLTGLPHVVRVRFVTLGGDFFVLGRDEKADWVRNLANGGRGKLKLDGSVFLVKAVPSEEEKSKILSLFREKFGASIVSSWYDFGSACLRLVVEGGGTNVPGVVGEMSVKKRYQDWKAEGKAYYGEVARAFDSASEEYDVTIGGNFINVWIRRRSLEILFDLLAPDDELLEIGAGTGAETVLVARRVSRVVAADLSPSMVELLGKKAEAKGLRGKIVPVRMAAGDIGNVKQMLDGGTVRVAYSFNGALNCEPRLDEFVGALDSVVAQGGYFVCSIRNTLCLSEMLTYAGMLQFKKMSRRKRQPIMISVGGMEIPSTYYGASEFIEHFRTRFEVLKVVALPVMLPPAYLNDYYVRVRPVARFIERLDRALSDKFPFNRLGDQTLFVFRKK